jgi:hypothetical protein
MQSAVDNAMYMCMLTLQVATAQHSEKTGSLHCAGYVGDPVYPG